MNEYQLQKAQTQWESLRKRHINKVYQTHQTTRTSAPNLWVAGEPASPQSHLAPLPEAASSLNPLHARLSALWNALNTKEVETISRNLWGASENESLVVSFLQKAVSDGDTPVVGFLLEHGHATPDQITPLAVAQARSLDLVRWLLEQGWDINTPQPRCGYELLQ